MNTGSDAFSAAARYKELQRKREPYERRAKECARFTIPSVYTAQEGERSTAETKIITPYQGVGAEGCSALASKLLLALLPPNTPPFRLRASDQVQQKALQEEEGKTALTLMDKAFARIEQTTQDYIEACGDRPAMFEVFLQLLIAGNALVYLQPDAPLRWFKLPYYTVYRKPNGEAQEIIARELVHRDDLPEKAREALREREESGPGPQTGRTETWPGAQTRDEPGEEGRELTLYTYVRRGRNKWETWQECRGLRLEGTYGTYPLDKCPWLPLRMYRADGEHYGRSYVETYLGELKSLEGLARAILEGAAASAKLLLFCNPNGTVRAKDLESAPNGKVLTGNATDVTTLSLEKHGDFSVALKKGEQIEQRLRKAFLLVEGVRRDAERVTAQEIREVAQELETTMGGVYSILSQDFGYPYSTVKLHQLTRMGRVPRLPAKSVHLSLVAGLEALGRGNDLNKLQSFLAAIQGVPPEAQAQYINWADYLSRAANACGLNSDGLVKDEEALAAEQAAAQEEAVNQQMLSTGIGAAGKALGNIPPEALPGAIQGAAAGLEGLAPMQPSM